jgi:hypothetical protein
VFDDAQSLAVRKAHVSETEIEALSVEESDRLGYRLSTRGVEPHARQRQLQQLQQVRLVVDNQYSWLSAFTRAPRHVRPPLLAP